jgi:hypothetical protein
MLGLVCIFHTLNEHSLLSGWCSECKLIKGDNLTTCLQDTGSRPLSNSESTYLCKKTKCAGYKYTKYAHVITTEFVLLQGTHQQLATNELHTDRKTIGTC